MGTNWFSGKAATGGPAPALAARVDPTALRAAAQRIDSAAETVLGAVRAGLGGMQFGPANAGRAHAGAGGALRAELDGLTTDLVRWGRAAAELAAALRAGADGHEAAELAAAQALR